jgi:hypothetical protein
MNMLKSAKKEILFIIPTTNSFIRQDKIGAIQLAKNALKERDVKVRILMPKVCRMQKEFIDVAAHELRTQFNQFLA